METKSVELFRDDKNNCNDLQRKAVAAQRNTELEWQLEVSVVRAMHHVNKYLDVFSVNISSILHPYFQDRNLNKFLARNV